VTHKSIPYIPTWATVIRSRGDKPHDCFLGIVPILNHTAITQIEGIQQKMQQICGDCNASPLGLEHHFDCPKIWRKVTCYISNHAADQKKVFQELDKIYRESNLELRGETAMLFGNPVIEEWEMDQGLVEKEEEMAAKTGGYSDWVELPDEERLRLWKEVIREAEICLGEQLF
jgi:hypothetical protein